VEPREALLLGSKHLINNASKSAFRPVSGCLLDSSPPTLRPKTRISQQEALTSTISTCEPITSFTCKMINVGNEI